jgi:hypothetical protein
MRAAKKVSSEYKIMPKAFSSGKKTNQAVTGFLCNRLVHLLVSFRLMHHGFV